MEISALDSALSRNHRTFYESLAPGTDRPTIKGEISQLFSWRNGQFREIDLLDRYTYPSYKQAQEYRKTLSTGTLTQRVAMRIFCRRPMRSIPLLYDVGGDGFFYDLRKNQVYYYLQGEPDCNFSTVTAFFEFLTELCLATSESTDAGHLFTLKYSLIEKYSRTANE